MSWLVAIDTDYCMGHELYAAPIALWPEVTFPTHSIYETKKNPHTDWRVVTTGRFQALHYEIENPRCPVHQKMTWIMEGNVRIGRGVKPCPVHHFVSQV